MMLTHFAVDLGAADRDAAVAGAGLCHGLLKVHAQVVPGVVGHDSLHDDAVGPVPGSGATPEPGAGRTFLVGEYFEVGQAAVVVHGGVDVRVAHTAGVGGGVAAVGPPPTAGGNAPQLLDVDVHQSAGLVVLVAADRSSRLAVHLVEAVPLPACQDPVHPWRPLAPVVRDAVRAPL